MKACLANPFTPTFGHVPFALAGRTEYIDDVIGGLANRPGDPNRSTIFVGPRGSGKTVLLTAISRMASEQGWVSANVSAREGMLNELYWQVRTNARHLLGEEPEADITSLTLGPVSVERQMRHADISWRTRMERLVRKLNEKGYGLLFTIDEVNPKCGELADFIDVYQHFVRDDLDVALLLAGLPGRISSLLQDDDASFVRRAFQRPMDAIPLFEVERALLDTITSGGRSIDDEALAVAADATKGFAFAIQLVGYYLWRQGSGGEKIKAVDATRAIELARREMSRSVFSPTLRELSPREQQYLQAMVLDSGPSSTSEVARRMGISMTNASNIRRRLIEHGVISEVRMGLVEFEMPMLKEYLQASCM